MSKDQIGTSLSWNIDLGRKDKIKKKRRREGTKERGKGGRRR